MPFFALLQQSSPKCYVSIAIYPPAISTLSWVLFCAFLGSLPTFFWRIFCRQTSSNPRPKQKRNEQKKKNARYLHKIRLHHLQCSEILRVNFVCFTMFTTHDWEWQHTTYKNGDDCGMVQMAFYPHCSKSPFLYLHNILMVPWYPRVCWLSNNNKPPRSKISIHISTYIPI